MKVLLCNYIWWKHFHISLSWNFHSSFNICISLNWYIFQIHCHIFSNMRLQRFWKLRQILPKNILKANLSALMILKGYNCTERCHSLSKVHILNFKKLKNVSLIKSLCNVAPSTFDTKSFFIWRYFWKTFTENVSVKDIH